VRKPFALAFVLVVSLSRPYQGVARAEGTAGLEKDEVVPDLPANVRFFVTVYPIRTSESPVDLRLDLVRDGLVVGSVPIPRPPADARGQIRYVGVVPTKTFRATRYAVRLVAKQGGTSAAEDAGFPITAQPQEPIGRIEPR